MSKVKKIDYQILIIEDDLVDKEIICRCLNSTNLSYEITHFESIKEAESYDWVRGNNRFNLIFLDYNFPTGVSSNFLHVQKNILKTKTPIIVVTGNESEVLKKNFSKYENVHFMTKVESNFKKLADLVITLLQEK